MKKLYKIEGMTCSSCVAALNRVLSRKKEITYYNVSLINESLEIESSFTDQEVINIVERAGFNATINPVEKKNNAKTKIIISFTLLILLMYISMGPMIGLTIPSFLSGHNNALVNVIVQFIITIIVVSLNFNYFKSGIKKLILLSPNMDTLIMLGSGASLIYGMYSLIMITIGTINNNMNIIEKYHMNLYFESAATIVTVVSIGKYIEKRSIKKANDSLSTINKICGKTANVIENGEVITKRIEDIRKNDCLIIKAGDIVPVDAKIIKGIANFDESYLTGESVLINKTTNDFVTSGAKNIDGYVEVEVVNELFDSTISKIVKMTAQAAASKSSVERIVDKISKIFVPTVIAISFITFITWLLITKNLDTAFNFGVSVLVISCPCAIGLATPIAILVSTSVYSKNHILIKDAKSIEKLHLIKTVIFDKTGTITTGKQDVCKIVKYNDMFDEIIYNIEKLSSHMIACSICNYYKDQAIKDIQVDDFLTIEGYGVMASINGVTYYLGNNKFIKANVKNAKEINTESSTIVIVASIDEVLGYLLLSDTVKETSKTAIDLFRSSGIETVMLTGDNEANALKIQQIVGVDTVIANTLPEEKGDIVLKYKAKNKTMMIGDGINDMIAITSSDVGVSVKSGSVITTDNADMVLINNDLLDAYNAYLLSKKTIKNIKFSLFWAFIYNIIFIPVASGLFYYSLGLKLSPTIASIAMGMSSLFVVFNALSLNRFKRRVK